jgi:hypothetical protein
MYDDEPQFPHFFEYRGLSPQEQMGQYFFEQLCTALGYALCSWQNVEDAHFRLFLRMLNAPNWETCSAAYYSIESFDARHKMVSRVAHYFLKGNYFKSHRETWCGLDGGLDKAIKDANTNRNKIAHYGPDFDDFEGDGELLTGLRIPKFRPTQNNLVNRLIGRAGDKPEHNLNVGAIQKYGDQFRDLANHIGQFEDSLTSQEQRPESEIAPAIAHPTGPKSQPLQSPVRLGQ